MLQVPALFHCQVPWVDELAEFATTTTPAKALAEDPPLESMASENTPENRELTVAPSLMTAGSVAEVA